MCHSRITDVKFATGNITNEAFSSFWSGFIFEFELSIRYHSFYFIGIKISSDKFWQRFLCDMKFEVYNWRFTTLHGSHYVTMYISVCL